MISYDLIKKNCDKVLSWHKDETIKILTTHRLGVRYAEEKGINFEIRKVSQKSIREMIDEARATIAFNDGSKVMRTLIGLAHTRQHQVREYAKR